MEYKFKVVWAHDTPEIWAWAIVGARVGFNQIKSILLFAPGGPHSLQGGDTLCP